MQLRSTLNHNLVNDLPHSAWSEQFSIGISSAHVVMRAGLAWVFELGISPDMPFYQRKNLALINLVSFLSLLMALPGTFLLLLMGFGHPFSLMVSWILVGCLVLVLNGVKHVEWSKSLFSFAPSLLILSFTMLELSTGGLDNPLKYILARQAFCFGLLIPILIFGFDEHSKTVGILGVCLLILMIYDLASRRLGVFHQWDIAGLSNGIFSILSLVQYAGLASCVLYMQHFTLQHALQAQRSNVKLHQMAIRDGMTGLFNHTFMEQLIGDAINRAKRSHDPLALLIIDVDLFKQVNDTFGHNAGDETLKELTQVINNTKRSTDYLGRWGGDEFILLLTNTNLPGAAYLAEKLRSMVAEHRFTHRNQLTISLGASEYLAGETLSDFVARADAAMYHAKHAGRNRVEVQTPLSELVNSSVLV